MIKSSNTYRYERKFFVNGIDAKTVEGFVLNNSIGFNEIYHTRWVNNIYFDYHDFRNFMDNVKGNEKRIKYRIRWYGDLFGNISKAKLELKIKAGLVGTKRLVDFPDFRLEPGINSGDLAKVIEQELSDLDHELRAELLDQYPVMLNRYQRKYFQSLDRRFRITIDQCQEFYRFNRLSNSFLQKVKDTTNTILEIKYDKDNDHRVEEITNSFPFRLTKSSKYARGIEMLY